MAAIKPAEAEGFLRRLPKSTELILLHGPDAGLVDERCRAALARAVKDPADPFQLVRLSGDHLAGNPERLIEEASAIGMFGPRKAIWVQALEKPIDRSVKLGTSTPNVDPSGDYAFEVFRRAELIKPGAQAALEQKALKLTGGASSAKPPPDRTVYGWHVAAGRADIFLTYCTNALAAQKENPAQQIVQLPSNLAVGADYGLTVINGSTYAAQQLADFILSPEGQKILMKYGFTPGK